MPSLDVNALAQPALDQLFLSARSHNGWLPDPVSDDTLMRLADLAKMGPTAMNSSPARFVFLRTMDAKKRLEPHLAEGNRAKTMQAPVVAIIGADRRFYDHMPKLFPHRDVKATFESNEKLTEATAVRNATLQGAYLMLAARALGLDCGPMSGFDAAGVDGEFFKGTATRVDFICALGKGDPAKIFPRLPRFEFKEFCTLL